MPITIDDDALHEWARGNGYVHSTILEQIRRLITGEPAVDLKQMAEPVITRQQIDTAFRSLVDFYTPRDVPATEAIKVGVSAGLALLTKFGAKKLSDVREEDFGDFLDASANKHFATAAAFIENLQQP